MKARIRKTILLLFLACISSGSLCNAREFSKAATVFQDVKDGVVSVFTSTGSGSGFLLDEAGLVVTNSHVVNEQAGHLRVKFGSEEIVEAVVLINDREHDVAILSVNLKNVQSHKTLPTFVAIDDKPLVVGEEIIAIGSPVDKDTLDRTMTTGIISKVARDVIYHNAALNRGNSGGPLFNYDGQVIGINSKFEYTTDGPDQKGFVTGPNAAVPVKFALAQLESAKTILKKREAPSAKLLPDVPEISYPISQLWKENPAFFKKRKPYKFQSSYFVFEVTTPPQEHSAEGMRRFFVTGIREQRRKTST